MFDNHTCMAFFLSFFFLSFFAKQMPICVYYLFLILSFFVVQMLNYGI